MSKPSRIDLAYEQLLHRLADGVWLEGGRLPPVRQLEAELGVSRVTVLAALRRVAEEGLVRRHSRRPAEILPGAARRCGHLLAALHAVPSRRRVAILAPEVFFPFRSDYAHMVKHYIVPAAAARDIQLEVVTWPGKGQKAFVEQIAQGTFGAAMAMGVRSEHLLTLHLLCQRQFPVLLFNRRLPDLPASTLFLDEDRASRQVASALVARGHRNLCLVYRAFDEQMRMGQDRVNGWLDFLKEAGVFGDCAIPVYYVTPNEKVNLFEPLLRLPNRPTAIVFGYASLWEQFAMHYPAFDLKVPDDISLATFDLVIGAPRPAWCPPLASMSDDVERTSACMIEMLDQMLGGNVRPDDRHVDLVFSPGRSIGPPPRQP